MDNAGIGARGPPASCMGANEAARGTLPYTLPTADSTFFCQLRHMWVWGHCTHPALAGALVGVVVEGHASGAHICKLPELGHLGGGWSGGGAAPAFSLEQCAQRLPEQSSSQVASLQGWGARAGNDQQHAYPQRAAARALRPAPPARVPLTFMLKVSLFAQS